MSSWNIIGWVLIGFVVLVAAVLTLFAVIAYVDRRIKHYRTRNTPPAVGQRWVQNGDVLRITRIYDNGRIGISSGSASWGDSPEDWSERVKNRKLYLEA